MGDVLSFLRSQRPSIIADTLFGSVAVLVLVVFAPQLAKVLFIVLSCCAGAVVVLVLTSLLGHWLRFKFTKE